MADTGPISTSDRIRGSLYGVAVADALGGPVEFCPRGSFPPVTSFRHNDTFGLPPGTWTDDTSMTFCLAQSLIDTRGEFVAQDQARKYIAWYREGYMSATGECFDIGGATRIALEMWDQYFAGETGVDVTDPQGHAGGQAMIDKVLKREVQCGNGSLMRLAPIPLVYHRTPAIALQNAALSSILTHPHPTNTEACQVYTRLITLIFSSSPPPKAELATTLATYPFAAGKLRDRFRKYTDLASFAAVGEDGIHSSGYVVSTLEAALWAFFTTDGFREGALKAVNLGYDADTVGAVYGGLAGAFYGVGDVPREWLEGLARRDMVEKVVEGVVKLVEKGGY